MSEAKHTPGPWQLILVGDRITRYAPANADRTSLLTLVNEDGLTFACVDSVADARLIAAAPELLEALKTLADDIADRFDMDCPSTNPGMKSAVREARAAIAKATEAS